MAAPTTVTRGYPALARIMGPYPGMSMFKRFAQLNARNLLYMQAEIIDLEQQLDAVALEDETGAETSHHDFSIDALKLREDADGEQWEMILDIRGKLKDYNAALIQQAELCKLERARTYDFKFLQNWFKSEEFDDLVVTSARPYHDSFTRRVAEIFLPWLAKKFLHKHKKPQKGHENIGLTYWKDEYFSRVSRIVSVLISTLFPSIAVLVLYFIHSLVARLGAILLFSLLFSLVLAVFTSARPVEIFAGTAACASVQVVFVGSTAIGNG